MAVRPTTLEDAAAVLAEAAGSGARITIGREADLDPTGLDRILEHEAGDLTCTVEAGIRLSRLQEALAPHGQRLALDPPGDPTIGACLAANLSGPLRHRFGSPRDLVLGATLVLGDGTIASSGGKVVKNVAGYDLAKLVCGSRGTLALIGRASLRLHPVAPASATLVVEPDDVPLAVHALLRSFLQPSALDVLHPGRVALLFEGSERAVAAQLDTAMALVGGAPAGPEVWAESRDRQGHAGGRIRFDPGSLREALTELGAAVVRPAAGLAYVPFAVDGDLPEVAYRVAQALKAHLDPAGVLA